MAADGRRGGLDLLGERVSALVAIGRGHHRAELFVGDVLEAGEMDLGLGGIAGALQGAGEAELGRGMHGIDADGFAIFVGGLGEVLAFEIAGTEEVVGVR